MVFSNLFFIYLFLPLNLILYFISSNKTWRNGVLLAFSFFFYAWGEPVWVFMLMLTAFLDYTWARCIEYFRLSGQSRRMKLALAASQTTVEYIQENVEKLRKGCLVMDICGVKKQVADKVAPLCKSCGVEYIGAHPMAGRERWGYQNSTEDLFDNASIILTPIFTDSWALQLAAQLCEQIGFGRVVYTDPDSHDKMIGYTSQLAHILSSAYIKNPLCMNYKGYTGGSFQDLTRVAKLNPIMWSELFLLNQQHLLDDLDILIGSLQEYRQALAAGDRSRLEKLLEEGSRIKQQLNEQK